MIEDCGGFYVEVESYNSRWGYDGRVWAVSFRNTDMLRRFQWLANVKVSQACEIKDKNGNSIADFLVCLPNMRNLSKGSDEHKKKVYLSQVGITTNQELGECILKQSEYVVKHGVECWVGLNREGISRNFGFLAMDSVEAANP
jgi:hypothetical protein